MLNNNIFYHGLIRKLVVAFGHLFSDIYIQRREQDSVKGNIAQTLQIPISYSNKEKWIVRIDSDPNLTNHTYTTLPRMAFEIVGYNYDSSRKMNKANKIVCYKDGVMTEMFAPVPYNVTINLYVLTKTQEDALQIIEQILPSFVPEYTMSLNMIPEMNVVQDIPLVLDSISVSDEYEGNFQTRRFVTHTLTFTAKMNLFGPTLVAKPIYHTEVDVFGSDETDFWARHEADGDPETGEIVERWIYPD